MTLIYQESKEFQMKIDLAPALEATGGTTEEIDHRLFTLAAAAVADATVASNDRQHDRARLKTSFPEAPWTRQGIRYDTADRVLRAQRLTLAIEATSRLTKLKCKQHDFVPEMLFSRPKRSLCRPDPDAPGVTSKGKVKLKREQDLHFDNLKYCASGSLFLKGQCTQVADLGFFSRRFPGLAKIAAPQTPLVAISHWDETVFDEMTSRYGRYGELSWMLVIRREHTSGQLLEAELSFKIEGEYGQPFDRPLMRRAASLYRALSRDRRFIALPPIFSFTDPVSSFDIRSAP